jgi:hypothetical protein
VAIFIDNPRIERKGVIAENVNFSCLRVRWVDEILCFPCHNKADQKRGRNTDQRRKNIPYLARLNGYKNKYLENFLDLDEKEIEVKFILFLYNQYCREKGPDFIEFWNLVLDGGH